MHLVRKLTAVSPAIGLTARMRFIDVTPGRAQFRHVPADPASVSASHLYMSPPQVLPNQQVDVSIDTADDGGEHGSHSVVLYINGNREDSCGVGV